MIRAERFNLITNLANEMDIITLDELADRLQVSVATVRRDVDELCSQGIVEKTRGGSSSVTGRRMPSLPDSFETSCIQKRKSALRRQHSAI